MIEKDYNICYDCGKQDDCSKRSEKIETCNDFVETVYRLTPKGIFSTVVHDMVFIDDIFDKRIKIAWELYEHRTRGKLVMDENVFEKVLCDMDFIEEDSHKGHAAFELMLHRMKNLGYLTEEE